MPTWVIYGLVALGIVVAISGGYALISYEFAKKDARILAQQEQIAADQIKIATWKLAFESAQKTINRQRADVAASVEQANRIKAVDAAERQRQADFDRKVQGINSRDSTNLDAINAYQLCISKDVNNTECGKLLQ